MGHHYLPQYYLKGFSNNSDFIWTYDKCSGKKFNTQIKNVANITNLYSTDFEQYSANNIEGPANVVLDKIRNKRPIDENDKKILSGYILVIWKRVPEALERFKKSVPKVGNELYKKIIEDSTSMDSQEPEKNKLTEGNKETIKAIIADLISDPPKNLWEDNIPPEKTPRVVAAFNRMKWKFLVIDDKNAEIFLTCDNPVFIFMDIGIGNERSEVTFPISSKIALFTTWSNDLPHDYIPITKQAIREINRRTVNNASRYVFHSRDEYWIQTFVKRGKWQLNRLS